MLHIEEEK